EAKSNWSQAFRAAREDSSYEKRHLTAHWMRRVSRAVDTAQRDLLSGCECGAGSPTWHKKSFLFGFRKRVVAATMCEFGNRQILVKPAGGDQGTAIFALRLDEQGVWGDESMQESLGLNWLHISTLSGSVVSGWSLLHSNSLLLPDAECVQAGHSKSVASCRLR